MANQRLDFTVGFNIDKANLQSIKSSLNEIGKMTEKDFLKLHPQMDIQDAKKELRNLQYTADDVSKAIDRSFNNSLGSMNTANLSKEINNIGLDKIYKQFNSAGIAGKSAFRGINAELMTTNLKLKETHNVVEKMGQTMGNTLKWSLSSMVMKGLATQISSAYGYVKGMDASLNDIRVVTGKGADEMARFAKEANSVAKEVSSSTRDITEGALIYYQQGDDDASAMEKARITQKVANVSNIDARDASEYTTAVWNGYQVANDAAKEGMSVYEEYMDKLAAVAASTATDLEETSIAISKVASGASAMGVDIDQLNAQIATIISVTRQAPESVGTALKTIYARLGDLAVDGEDEFGTKLGEVSGKMKQMGIDVVDSSGDLRDMGTVIEETAAKWDTWTSAQKQAAAVAIAGKRQYNNLIALFDNWGMYTDAIKTSAEAMGTLNEQQDIWSERTDAHLQKMRTSWEGVYDSLLDTKSVNTVADAWGGVATVLEHLIDSAGGGLSVVTALSSVLMKTFSGQLAKEMQITINNFRAMKENGEALKQEIDRIREAENQKGTRDPVINQMLADKEILLKNKSLLSNKEFNETDSLIKTASLTKDLQLSWEEALKAKAAYYAKVVNNSEEGSEKKYTADDFLEETRDGKETRVAGKNPGNILNVGDIFDSALGELEGVEKNLEDKIKKLQEDSKNIMERAKGDIGPKTDETDFEPLKDTLKEISEESKNLFKNLPDNDPYVDALKAKVENLKEEMDDFKVGKDGEIIDEVATTEALDKIIAKIKEAYAEAQAEFDKQRDEALNMRDVEFNQDKGDKQSDINNRSHRDAEIGKNTALDNVKQRGHYDDLIKKAGALSQMTFGLQSTIGSVTRLFDDSVDPLDKMTQLITGMAMGIPAIALSWGQVNDILDIGLTKLLKLGGANTEAIEGMAGLLPKVTSLFKMLGPAGIAAGLVAAGAGAVAIIQKAMDESAKAKAEKYHEANENLEEERSQNSSLQQDYENLKKQYEETGKGKKELEIATAALNRSLGTEGDMIINSTDSLEEYRKKLVQVRLEKSKGIDGSIATKENEAIAAGTDADQKIRESKNWRRYGKTYFGKITEQVQNSDERNIVTDILGKDAVSDFGQVTLKGKNTTEGRKELGDKIQEVKEAFREAGIQDSEFLDAFKRDTADFIESVANEQNKITDAQQEKGNAVLDELSLGRDKIDSQTDFDKYRDTAIDKIKDSDNKLTQDQAETIFSDYVNSLDKDLAEFDIKSERARSKVKEFEDDVKDKFYKKDSDGELSDRQRSRLEDVSKKASDMGISSLMDTSALSKEDWEKVFGADSANEAMQYILDQTREQMREGLKDNDTVDKTLNAAQGLGQGIISGDVTSLNAGSSDDFLAMKEQLQALAVMYPELTQEANTLSQEWAIGTQLYMDNLDSLKDKLTEIQFNDLGEKASESINKAIDELSDLDGVGINVELETDEFMDTMGNLLSNDYAVNVAIHTDAENAFDDLMAGMSEIEDAAGMIGENYIVAADDIRELNNVFPGIIDGMQQVGDGSFQLSQERVQNAMAAAQGEASADAQGTVEQLKHQSTLLHGKQAAYSRMAAAASQLATTETLSSKQSADLRAEISGGLADVEALNSEISSTASQTSQQNVATSSGENSHIVAENFSGGFKAATQASAQFAQAAISNMQAVAAGGGSIRGDIDGAQWKGQNGVQAKESKLGKETKKALDSGGKNTTSEQWASLAAQYQSMASSAGAAANDIDGMIAQIGASSIDFTKGTQNVKNGQGYSPKKGSGGGGSGGKGGGGGSPKEEKVKDPDKMENLEEELDRYHDINIKLKELETSLSRVEKQQKKTFGADLLKNLNEQIKLLEKQKQLSQEKLDIAKIESDEIRQRLSKQGVSFGADGDISNYAKAYQEKLNATNAVINKYNNMTAEEQEVFKESVEKAKKDFEKFKEDISRYDTITSDEIPDLQDKMQEALDKQIELQIDKFKMSVDLKIDMAEAERDFNEFKKKVIDQIKDDDILGNAMAQLKDFYSYYKENGKGVIDGLTNQVNDTIKQLNDINAGGTSSVYGDNKAAALEDLKKYADELMDNLESVEELIQDIKESYLDMIDEAKEKFDDQIDQYEYIADLMNHDMNVIGLLYGEDAYEELEKYYNMLEQNNNSQLDFYRKQVDFWKERLDAEEEGSEAWEEYKKNWQDAVAGLNATVENSIENLVNKYKNAVDKIFQAMNNSATSNKGLDYLGLEWDLMNKNADRYLDKINSAFAISQLENKYKKAIGDTDSIAAQEKLNGLMNEQLEMLKNKEKLTQYDVDRANMLYDIALKEIALKEAQQNKSKMRLRRDSQGNYSYQYVSDEDSIAQAQQELAEAQNSLYNFDKAQYKQNLDDLYNTYSEFQQKLYDLYSDQTLTEEEREAKKALLVEQYGEIINGIVEENESIRQNLSDSAFQELANMYDVDVEHFQNMSDAEKDILMNDLIPAWNGGLQEMADSFAGDNGFITICMDALKDLEQATKDYQDSLKDLQDSAGVNFEEITNGVNNVIDINKDLLQGNQDLVDNYGEQLDAIKSIIAEMDMLISKYKVARDAAVAASKAAYDHWQTENRIAADKAAKEAAQQAAQSGGGSESSSGSSGSGSSGSGSGGSGSNNGTPEIGDTVTFVKGIYYYDSYGTSPNGSRGIGKTAKITHMNPSAPFPIHVESSDGAFGWLKKDQISGYDTGGYTGNWDKSGKLAFLHQKELVLNAKDTENVLSAVSVVRDMDRLLEDINNSALMNVATMIAKANAGIANTYTNVKETTVKQDVSIKAEFPNVSDSREIEEAFNNLVNIASQHAYNTDK